MCRQMRGQTEQLFLLGSLFEELAGEIGYSRACLPELLQSSGRRLLETPSGITLGEALLRVSGRMEEERGQCLEEIWEEEMGRFLESGRLSPEKRRWLLRFPDLLGYPDGGRQQESVERLAQRFCRAGEELRQRSERESRAILAVSAACGLLTVVLLF